PLHATGELFDAKLRDFFQSPNGRVTVAGLVNYVQPFIQRLLPDGRADPSFPQAKLLKALHKTEGLASPFALQKDGGILVGVTLSLKAGITRITPQGTFDSHFGNHGVAMVPVHNTVTGIGVLPDGRIAVSG